MKKKSLIKKSTVKKVESLPLLNAAIAMTVIDGNVNCEMCGSRLSLITSITTLILAFSKRSKMPLNDVLDMVTYQVKQEIAEQDAEARSVKNLKVATEAKKMKDSRQFLTEVVNRATNCLEHNGIATVTLPQNYKIEKPEDIDCMTVTDKVMTEIVNNRNQVFVRSVLEWAKSNGYTYINLIDEQFIKAAFSAEFNRRRGNEKSEFDRGYAIGYNEGFIAGLQESEPNV